MSRFQADPDQLIQQISTFGTINSISHTYTAWCAGQVIVSPAMISSVSAAPVPPSSSATTTSAQAEPDLVSVAQSTGKDDGRKKMEQEKAANPASVNKQQQQQQRPVRKDPTQPSPPETCASDELLARQERVKASLLAQGVILYPPAGELAPSKKSARRDRKRRSGQRPQDSGPAQDGSVKETANPPSTKTQTSTNSKPPASSVSRPQASTKLESASTVSTPAEKINEKKGGGPASSQGPKAVPPSRDNQKVTSAPQSRPKGAHYEQSVIIVHTKPRNGRGQRSRQQPQHPRPAQDNSRGGQGRQQREDRRRAAKPSKQQPDPTLTPNGSEGGPSVVEEPQKQEEAVVPEKGSDPGNKPEADIGTLSSSPLAGQTAPGDADLPGAGEKAAVETQSEEITFMDASTSSTDPGGEKQEKSTHKQLLRVTPSPDLAETPLSEEEIAEESFQLKDDLTSEPQTGEE